MTGDFKVDYSGLLDASNELLRNAAKAMAAQVNRTAFQVIVGKDSQPGVMQLMHRDSTGKINAVADWQIRAYVVSRLRAAGTLAQVKFQDIERMTKQERVRRLAAVGYTAYVGWNESAGALGHSLREAHWLGKRPLIRQQIGDMGASYGHAAVASETTMTATIVNTTPMGETLGAPFIDRAVASAGTNMEHETLEWLTKLAREVGF